MKLNLALKSLRQAAAAGLLLAAAGCSSDDPTSPDTGGGPGVPPGGGVGTGTWSITVTADPPVLTLPAVGSTDAPPTSFVTVRVRGSNGAAPPTGTTVLVSFTLGTISGNLCTVNATNGTAICELVAGATSFTFTPTAAGTAVITARLEASSGQTTILINAPGEVAPFVLSHAQPGIGDPAGGEEVRIFAADGSRPFEAPVTVTFGGVNAVVLGVNAGVIRVRTPARPGLSPGETATVDVTVTNAAGTIDQAIATLAGGFTYAFGNTVVQPQIFSVSPLEGPYEGNTRVTVNGTGFQTPVQLIFAFGTVELEATLESVTSSQIVARTPDARPFIGSGDPTATISAQIRVVNQLSGSQATAAQPFFYGPGIRITSVNPNRLDFAGGDRVVVIGHGFDEPLTVTVGGVIQSLISVSGTEIIFNSTGFANIACDAQPPATLVVTNHEGGASDDFGIFIVGPTSPVVAGVSPNSRTVGQTTTVSGQNFPPLGDVRVAFGGSGGSGGSSAAISSASPTSILVTVPSPPPGFVFNTEACDGNGDGIPGGTRPVETPMDVTVTNLDTGCFDVLPNGLSLVPTSTTCTGDTSTPPPPPTVQCNDTFDNDGDGFIDQLDPQCTGPTDTSESS